MDERIVSVEWSELMFVERGIIVGKVNFRGIHIRDLIWNGCRSAGHCGDEIE